MASQLVSGCGHVLVSQTGIECQPDMLRDGGKSYTHIWHVAVIGCPWAEGGWVGGRAGSRVETRLRLWRVYSQECGLLLAEHARLVHTGTYSLPSSRKPEHKDIGSSPTLPDCVLDDESDAGHRSKLLYSK